LIVTVDGPSVGARGPAVSCSACVAHR
jgi:hypothetical protein